MCIRKLSKQGNRLAGWKFVACGLVLGMASPAAQAASSDSRERAARKACLQGNVEKGIEILTDLFLETKDVNHIYNMARCYEQNHRYEDSISRFREYLLKAPNLTEKEKAETEKHVDACQRYLSKTEAAAPSVAQPQPPPSATPLVPSPSAAVSPGPAGPQPVAEIQLTPTNHDGHAGFGLRAAGVATLAVGGAAVITGVLLNLKVNSMSSDLEKHYSTDTNSTREGYKTLSEFGYGVGAACVAGGALLYSLGWNRGQASSATVTLAPVMMGGQLGATLGGSF